MYVVTYTLGEVTYTLRVCYYAFYVIYMQCVSNLIEITLSFAKHEGRNCYVQGAQNCSGKEMLVRFRLGLMFILKITVASLASCDASFILIVSSFQTKSPP